MTKNFDVRYVFLGVKSRCIHPEENISHSKRGSNPVNFVEHRCNHLFPIYLNYCIRNILEKSETSDRTSPPEKILYTSCLYMINNEHVATAVDSLSY